MKSYSYREMSKIVRANGYQKVRARGDHVIFKNEKGKVITLTTAHTNICVATRLLKELRNE